MLATDTATIGLVLLLAVIVGIITITALVTRTESSKVSVRLLEGLQSVPLFRVLQKSNVDPVDYVRVADPAQIRQQIATCESCSSSEACETTFDDAAERGGDYSFCPNETAIVQARQAVGNSSNASR